MADRNLTFQLAAAGMAAALLLTGCLPDRPQDDDPTVENEDLPASEAGVEAPEEDADLALPLQVREQLAMLVTDLHDAAADLDGHLGNLGEDLDTVEGYGSADPDNLIIDGQDRELALDNAWGDVTSTDRVDPSVHAVVVTRIITASEQVAAVGSQLFTPQATDEMDDGPPDNISVIEESGSAARPGELDDSFDHSDGDLVGPSAGLDADARDDLAAQLDAIGVYTRILPAAYTVRTLEGASVLLDTLRTTTSELGDLLDDELHTPDELVAARDTLDEVAWTLEHAILDVGEPLLGDDADIDTARSAATTLAEQLDAVRDATAQLAAASTSDEVASQS